MTEPTRLAKRVAELRACSRREAEQYITDGWVRVDGAVVETPQFRITDQRVDIDPLAVLSEPEPVTLLLHKPAGCVTTDGGMAALALLNAETQWDEDASGLRPLKKHFAGLTLCGPLEADASGLIVLTQDWRIVRKLTDDAATLEHEVVVEVAGTLPPDGLKKMSQGLRSSAQGVGPARRDAKRPAVPGQERSPPVVKVSWQNETRLRVAMKGAKFGQIAALCEAAGLEVLSMKRIRLAGVSLGKVPPGQWRYLREDERF